MSTNVGETSLTTDFDRLPPRDISAEMCALSSMMLCDKPTFCEIRAMLRSDMFFQADHAILFDTICQLDDQGKERDGVVLRAELDRRGLLQEIGGVAYLAQVLNAAPDPGNGKCYAAIVRDKSVLRDILKLSQDMSAASYGPQSEESSTALAQKFLKRLSDIAMTGADAKYHQLLDVLGDVLGDLEKGETELIKTGFPSLDGIIGGIAPGEMVLIGGRPSMGKSLLAKQLGVQIAEQGVPVAILSLEEQRRKIVRNMLASGTGLENQRLRRGNLDPSEWAEVSAGANRLGKLPLFICDRARRMADIRAVASVLVAKHGVKVLIIDYLQRIGAEGRDRYSQVSNAATAVSDLIKELGVVGIVAAQLNRGVEGREDKRPTMSDLRESGQIEQDADGIIFVHREDYYHIDDGKYTPTEQAELIIAKWRDGVRGGVVQLKSELKYQRFSETGF